MSIIQYGFSLVVWRLLPSITTYTLRTIHLTFPTLLGRTSPPEGSPEWERHYSWLFNTLGGAYFLFTLSDALDVGTNYYQVLKIAPDADEQALKLAFRQFARRFHPDRVGPQGESFFIEIRDAYEAFKSPLKRFAYDRFGPDALHWSHCTTPSQFIHYGIMSSLGFYVVSSIVLVACTFLGHTHPVTYWRYLHLVFTAIYELVLVLSPVSAPMAPGTRPQLAATLFAAPGARSHTSALALAWPHRAAFQHVRLLHKLFISVQLALGSFAHAVLPAAPPLDGAQSAMIARARELGEAAEAVKRETDAHVNTLLHTMRGARSDATFPFTGAAPDAPPADDAVAALAAELEDVVLDARLRAESVRLGSVVEQSVARARRRHARQAKERALAEEVARVAAAERERAAAERDYWTAGGAYQHGNGSARGSPVGSPRRGVVGYIRGRSRSLG
ncbi:DnaJ-domain-containing protein [Epithele typhae]|uniref:DnaJ-domain-containing protein n=1 Tax=Epithele typhae TaxID=378194 RepID=UPI0020083B12|nr:DnaJ-domain-containing protein [Epithele typhae]KAH9935210.1 DnaJ-domain-containing protein [Epithele typhae]